MDKIAKVPHLREELDWLDQTYGVEKEGFFHQDGNQSHPRKPCKTGNAWGSAPNPGRKLRSLHPFFASRRFEQILQA